jgi:hypothetical protein
MAPMTRGVANHVFVLNNFTECTAREPRMSKVIYIHCELQNIRDAEGLCGNVEA